MRKRFCMFFAGLIMPIATFASNEGVPSYYQTNKTNGNKASYEGYADQGYKQYVGQSGTSQVIDTRTYTYQTQKQQTGIIDGTMTVNGIAVPVTEEKRTSIYAGYSRRFADFEFKTGVNSVLEWDDMVYDEINVGVQHNFSLRNFDMFIYGQYAYGQMNHGGFSMDYDLEPYSWSNPEVGIFTISVGEQSGSTNHFKFGIGARHVWDIAGWKLSPSIGYEIFKHNLKMNDHMYPNDGIYLPLLANNGQYVYGDADGNYYTVPMDMAAPDDWYQVCMAPEDILLVETSGISYAGGYGILGTEPVTTTYNSAMGDVPWRVSAGDCVIIGGDGPIMVSGTTHIYNTTWSGFYVGLEAEKQMTLYDKLRFYVQVGLPKYSSEGTWPNRDDWQQNPSFLDEGSSGAYSYAAELEYNLKLSDRLQLALKVDTNYFHVGKIGGEIYWAEYTDYVYDDYGYPVFEEYVVNGDTVLLPIIETTSAYTQKVSDQLKYANWQSFGIHLGLKYLF